MWAIGSSYASGAGGRALVSLAIVDSSPLLVEELFKTSEGSYLVDYEAEIDYSVENDGGWKGEKCSSASSSITFTCTVHAVIPKFNPIECVHVRDVWALESMRNPENILVRDKVRTTCNTNNKCLVCERG